MTLITTPTGNIGSKVLNEMLKTGEKLRVLVRNPAKLSASVRDKVSVVEGSLEDQVTVSRALQGVEQLFLIIPPNNICDNINDYYLRFSHLICDEIKTKKISRVVFVSGTGLGVEKNAGAVSAAFLVEQHLAATKVNLRILHCGTFMENLLHSVLPIKMKSEFSTTVPADVKLPWVATQDIANVAIRLLADKSWKGQSSVGVLGPRDLSYGEIAKIMGEVLKKEISYKTVPSDQYKAMLRRFGTSEAAAQGLLDIYASMTNGVFNQVARSSETSSPTQFRNWCESVFKPALEGISLN